MGSSNNSDIIEIKLYDSAFTVYFKQHARVKDRKDIEKLNATLRDKGLSLSVIKSEDWFD
jgi:hypothetical protein